jgi:hypothetical protein
MFAHSPGGRVAGTPSIRYTEPRVTGVASRPLHNPLTTVSYEGPRVGRAFRQV